MRQPISAVVTYLNKHCSTNLEKVRAYFRWLCTRDVTALIAPDPETDHEDAVLKALMRINDDKNGGSLYSHIYADMCRHVYFLGGVIVWLYTKNFKSCKVY